jgi:N-acyl-D-amino-acid deacylase
MYDLLLQGGKIMDGAGNPWYWGDVAVTGGKIAAIGNLKGAPAKRTIDVSGLMVAPGFIDMHTHSDLTLLANPLGESSIRQGVTTEVVCSCGLGPAPTTTEKIPLIKNSIAFVPDGLDWSWRTFDDFLNKYGEIGGTSTNVVPLVPQGAIRIAAMGFDNRVPTDTELAYMKRLVAESMEAGGWGFATGLIYTPGKYAQTQELIELSREAAVRGGIYVSHIRGEGETLLESVDEAMAIGKTAGMPVHISHHKASGKANWGKVNDSLRMMEEARAGGLDVTSEVYPYTAGSTSMTTLLASWAHEGGILALFERLENPEMRARLKKEMREGLPGWENMALANGWENMVIAWVKSGRRPDVEGRNLAELAARDGKDPEDFVIDLLISEKDMAAFDCVYMVAFSMDEDDVRTVLKHPLCMIGSDGRAVAPYGILKRGKPHPRYYGTFARVIGKYAREEKVISMQEAVRKMTSMPAQRIGLRDRGLLREGFRADITVFDPDKIIDRSTYAEPHQYPAGVPFVIVNGQVTIENGEHAGTRAGHVLRKNRPEK